MNNFEWKFVSKKKFDSPEKVVDQILKSRKLKNKKEFLNPTHPDKISLKKVGLEKSQINILIKRLKKAKKNKEKVIVYGDYDADGITATAILWQCMYKQGVDALPYIPNRFTEGYGLNVDTVKSLKSDHPALGLVVTVDNGIVAHEAAKELVKLKVDLIVSDHHQKESKLPKALSIIHSTQLSGAGIAWFIARESGGRPPLELAAIGTIADQLDLIGPNRSLAKFGIEALNKTKNTGLLALFQATGIKKGDLGTYHVNYMLAPRINAAGRMKHGIDALRLLCTKKELRANDLARQLDGHNKDRRFAVDNTIKGALSAVDSKQKGIVLSADSYHEGIIGLIASKIAEKHFIPAIVISTSGNGIGKASARSIPGFSIVDAIRKLEHLIVQGGGHDMAAGFTIKKENIDKFEKEFYKITKKIKGKPKRTIQIETILEPDQINQEYLNNLKKLEPHGRGNERPVFATIQAVVDSTKAVGREGAHLKAKFEKDGTLLDAIGFYMGPDSLNLEKESAVNLAYFLDENEWNGVKTIQLQIKDIHKL